MCRVVGLTGQARQIAEAGVDVLGPHAALHQQLRDALGAVVAQGPGGRPPGGGQQGAGGTELQEGLVSAVLILGVEGRSRPEQGLFIRWRRQAQSDPGGQDILGVGLQPRVEGGNDTLGLGGPEGQRLAPRRGKLGLGEGRSSQAAP